MTTDHYQALGVPRDADDKTIKQAYRKKSMKAHPDRGGNEEDQKRLNQALAVLEDPAKRKHYDETGQDDIGQNHVEALLASLAEELLKDMYDGADLIKTGLAKLDEALRNMHNSLLGLDKEITKLEKSKGRIVVDTGTNVFEALIDRKLSDAKSIKAMKVFEMDQVRKARAILQEYKDTKPPQKPSSKAGYQAYQYGRF